MSVEDIVKEGGILAVYHYYENFGPEFVKAFKEMVVFDAVICNTDRRLPRVYDDFIAAVQ